MNIYLVGGAVRDLLLNNPVTDRDWVVVGATPQDLLNQGYIQVGKDFPVFLHPQTKEEYALARTERKSGSGYTGFVCDFNPDITLEQDLERRDLTINAIAMDKTEQIIDPFGGIKDLEQRILRHVSPAFKEDPLRILRVARFAARYHHLDFSVADETMELMRDIVDAGEIQTLTAERVWKETEKAFLTHDPDIYFKVLNQCGALEILFPELARLFTLSHNQQTVNLGLQSLSILKQTSQLSKQPELLFTALCLNFGFEIGSDNSTMQEQGLIQIIALSDRFKISSHYKKTATVLYKAYWNMQNIMSMDSEQLLTLLNRLDVWRAPHRLDELCLINQAATQIKDKTNSNKQNEQLKNAYLIAKSIDVQKIIQQGYSGQAIHEQLNYQRVLALKGAKNSQFGHISNNRTVN